jgi:hypothetical protein
MKELWLGVQFLASQKGLCPSELDSLLPYCPYPYIAMVLRVIGICSGVASKDWKVPECTGTYNAVTDLPNLLEIRHGLEELNTRTPLLVTASETAEYWQDQQHSLCKASINTGKRNRETRGHMSTYQTTFERKIIVFE